MRTNNKTPAARDAVMRISAYVPGKSSVAGVKRVHKLSSNETPLGPSPKAVEACRDAATGLERYPDPTCGELRAELARLNHIDAARIICGNGSDDVLNLLAQCYLGPGNEAIYSEHGFSYYPIVIRAAGAEPVPAPEIDCRVDVDQLLAQVSERTKMVFIANPNNPTGTYLAISEIHRLHAALPSDVILVLDAAYAEYVGNDDYQCGIDLVSKFPNVVMTRTFSKIYGLAALRVGWAYGPQAVVDVLNRLRGPFNVNKFAQVAATASLLDSAHVEKAAAHNRIWLAKLIAAVSELGLVVTPSVGNFILIHFPPDRQKGANAAFDYLASQGYVLRTVGSYGLPNALRMTVGTKPTNEGAIDALAQFLRGTN